MHTIKPAENKTCTSFRSFCSCFIDEMNILKGLSKNPYWKLTKFLVPLALTVTVQDVGEQVYFTLCFVVLNLILRLQAVFTSLYWRFLSGVMVLFQFQFPSIELW